MRLVEVIYVDEAMQKLVDEIDAIRMMVRDINRRNASKDYASAYRRLMAAQVELQQFARSAPNVRRTSPTKP